MRFVMVKLNLQQMRQSCRMHCGTTSRSYGRLTAVFSKPLRGTFSAASSGKFAEKTCFLVLVTEHCREENSTPKCPTGSQINPS